MSKVAENAATLIKSFVPMRLLFAAGIFTSNLHIFTATAFFAVHERDIVLVFCLSAMVELTFFAPNAWSVLTDAS